MTPRIAPGSVRPHERPRLYVYRTLDSGFYKLVQSGPDLLTGVWRQWTRVKPHQLNATILIVCELYGVLAADVEHCYDRSQAL
jgi:hypothetical protein